MAFPVRSRVATALAALAAAGLASSSSAQVTTSYTYDRQGQVKTVVRSSNTVTYGYDAAGNRTAVGVSYPPPGSAVGSMNVPFGGSASLALPVTGQVTGAALDAAPAKGSVAISGTTATYTAGANSYGADSFTYHASGPGGNSPVQTISVTIGNPPSPTVSNKALSVAYQTGGSVSIAPTGVYTSVTILTQPAHGQAGNSGNPTIADYIPAAGYYGADSFTYNATGPGGTSAPATVSVTVANPPAPTVSAVSASTAYNTAVSIGLSPAGVYSALAVASGPSHGAASISGTTATYTPTSGYSGADSFTYTASGPGGTSSAASVSVNVAAPPANRAPIANGDSVTLPAGENVDVNVAANDTDPDGDTLTVASVSPTSTIRASYYAHDGYINVQAKTKTGSETITYTISDGRGASASASLQVVVGPPQ